jgi:hypothetical protein
MLLEQLLPIVKIQHFPLQMHHNPLKTPFGRFGNRRRQVACGKMTGSY